MAGYIRLAHDLGDVNLGQLHSAFGANEAELEVILQTILEDSVIDLPGDLGWTYINLRYQTLKAGAEKIRDNFNSYTGMAGYIKLAHELGGMNLGQLHSAFGANEAELEVILQTVLDDRKIDLPGDLGWTIIVLPYQKLKAGAEKIRDNFNKYTGMAGYIELAHELGDVNLGLLYSAFGTNEAELEVILQTILEDSVIDLPGDLGWTKINLRYQTLKAGAEKIRDNFNSYTGMTGYIRLAHELGDVNLGHLYSAFGTNEAELEVILRTVLDDSRIDFPGDLGWTIIDLPYQTLKAGAEKIRDNFNSYTGMAGYIRIAHDLGDVNMSQLYSAFGATETELEVILQTILEDLLVDLPGDLGWTIIVLPYEAFVLGIVTEENLPILISYLNSTNRDVVIQTLKALTLAKRSEAIQPLLEFIAKTVPTDTELLELAAGALNSLPQSANILDYGVDYVSQDVLNKIANVLPSLESGSSPRGIHMESGIILISSEITPSQLELERLEQYLGHAPNADEIESLRKSIIISVFIHEIDHAVFASIFRNEFDSQTKTLDPVGFIAQALTSLGKDPANVNDVQWLNEQIAFQESQKYLWDVGAITEAEYRGSLDSTFLTAFEAAGSEVTILQGEVDRVTRENDLINPAFLNAIANNEFDEHLTIEEMKERGRTAMIKVENGDGTFTYYGIKFAKDEADVQNLMREERELRRWYAMGLNAQEVVQSVGEYHGEFGQPEFIPNKLTEGKVALVYRAPKEYFEYATENLIAKIPDQDERLSFLNNVALKNMNDITTFLKNGYYHNSLTPLTHGDRPWYWGAQPIGPAGQLRENLAYPNLRLSGIADFEHVYPIDQYGSLYDIVGKMLSETIITFTYSGLVNQLSITQVHGLLTGVIDKLSREMSVSIDLSGAISENLSEFIRLAKKDLDDPNTNRLSSEFTMGDQPTLDRLVTVVRAISQDISDLSPYAKLLSGRYTTIGSPGSGEGQFDILQAPVFGPDGNMYVAEWGNDRIQVFDSEGNYLRTIGSSGSGEGQFDIPQAPVFGPDGNMYVAEDVNDRIQVFDREGNYLRMIGSSGSGEGQFDIPQAPVFGPDGNMYVADWGLWNIKLSLTTPRRSDHP